MKAIKSTDDVKHESDIKNGQSLEWAKKSIDHDYNMIELV